MIRPGENIWSDAAPKQDENQTLNDIPQQMRDARIRITVINFAAEIRKDRICDSQNILASLSFYNCSVENISK